MRYLQLLRRAGQSLSDLEKKNSADNPQQRRMFHKYFKKPIL